MEQHDSPTFNCPFQKEFGTWENSIKNIESSVEKIEKHLAQLNGRTRKLENWRSWLLGAIAVIAFGMGFALKLL